VTVATDKPESGDRESFKEGGPVTNLSPLAREHTSDDTKPGTSGRAGRYLVPAAITLVLVVLAVVGFTIWRAHNGSATPTTTYAAPTAPPSQSAEQQAQTKALAAYNGFRQTLVTAFATADYNNADLATYAVDPALAQAKYDLYQLRQAGLVVTGLPTWHATVSSVDLGAHLVKIVDCFDDTNWHTINKATGQVVDAPGQAHRYVINAEVKLAPNGHWLVSQTTADRRTPC
jgi:hypothetical protein